MAENNKILKNVFCNSIALQASHNPLTIKKMLALIQIQTDTLKSNANNIFDGIRLTGGVTNRAIWYGFSSF